MRTTILLCTLLLLVGCPGTKTDLQAPGRPADDTPIIISEGSILIRSVNEITFQSATQAYVDLRGNDAKSYEKVQDCTSSGGLSSCFSKPDYKVQGKDWSLNLCAQSDCSVLAASLSSDAKHPHQIGINITPGTRFTIVASTKDGVGLRLDNVDLLATQLSVVGGAKDPIDTCDSTGKRKCTVKIGTK